MITVLHVITDLDAGGAETFLLRLVTGTDGARIKHHVVSLADGGSLRPAFEQAGIPVASLGMTGGASMPRAIWRLVRIIRALRPDAISTWLYHADFIGTVAALATPCIPLVWNIRCADMDLSHYALTTRMLPRVLARLSRRPAVVTANSEAGRRFHAGLGYRPRQWRVLPNGFDTSVFRPDPEARRRIRDELGLDDGVLVAGLIARLDPMKDHMTFLKAAALVAARLPEARFLVAGRGTNDERMARMAAEAGLESTRLLCLGERRDIPAIMASLDVCVSSSITEGFSNTIGEAMACGIPCVVTDAGDSALIVGDSGSVAPIGDAAALGKTMLDVLMLPFGMRNALGKAARKHIRKQYSLKATTESYDTLYLKLRNKKQNNPLSRQE